MNERFIIRYLHEKEAGVSSYLAPLPAQTVYLAPDVTAAGRFTRFENPQQPPFVCTPTEEERDQVVWQGCEPTTASRIPPARTKRSFRIRSTDREDNREVVFESILEYGFWLIQRAEDRRRKIFEQPPARFYMDSSGVRRRHTFDLLVEEADGSRIAYAVRPEQLVERKGLRSVVEALRRGGLQGFADTALIRTERFVTKSRVRNALEILNAREMCNANDVEIASAFVAQMRGGAMLGHIVDRLAMGPRGRVAVLNLLDDKVLECVRKERITATTLLRPTSNPTLQ